MGAFKTYAWESAKFPWERRIKILPRYRVEVARALAAHFQVRLGLVECVTRGGGNARQGFRIQLPAPGYSCDLGLIIHEVAHCYDYQHHGNNGHQNTWRNSLSVLYYQARPMWRTLLLRAKGLADENAAHYAAVQKRQAERLARNAQHQAERKLVRKSRAYRILNLHQRVKRLESRRKRLDTLLKSARRSLNTLERLEASATTKAVAV